MARTGGAVAVLAALLALAGCGGSHKTSSSTTSTATSTVASGGRLTETVGIAGKGKSSGQVTAAPGDSVQIKTDIAGPSSAPAQRVTVSAATGPATTLHITASSPRHRARARITSGNGKSLTLVDVHYTCALPKTPTFCPVQQASSRPGGFKLAFMASPRTGVALTATVGPVPGPPPHAVQLGGLPTAAYTPTELLRASAPGAGAPGAGTGTSTATGTASTATTFTTTIGTVTTTTSTFATTTPTGGTSTTPPTSAGLTPAVSVAPGTIVTMVTQLSGLPGGLPQQTTITIPKGPAKALTVSAAVPEAHTSRATITRAGGGRLALDPPQFKCEVAPAPTFCPPQSIVSKKHEYIVTFMAAPRFPPIVFQAHVRAA